MTSTVASSSGPPETPQRVAAPAHGTVGAVLKNRNFRTMWLGMFASQIGTWMQNVALPAYVDDRTHSATWVAVFAFAQMGPLLLLSIPGGVLADRFRPRPWMIVMQSEQLVLSLVVAGLVAGNASLHALLFVQVFVGIGNALNAPAMQGTVPNLVPREDLPGAISLNSVMINGSRVIGPSIAAVLLTWGVTTSQIFIVNAVTYLFVIYALIRITMPPHHKHEGEKGFANLMIGIRIARERTVVGRLLLGMTFFSFAALPYVALFPAVARLNYHATGGTYRWLYATWGLGACMGALSIGTFLAKIDKRKLIAPFFVAFGVMLAAFTAVRSSGPAFPIGFVLGFFYFGLATCMLTVVQQNLHNHERARVMSLWFMAFGGTVGICGLVFGPIVDAIGARPVMYFGAISAVALAYWCDVSRRSVVYLEDEPAVALDDHARKAIEAGAATGFDENGASAGQ